MAKLIRLNAYILDATEQVTEEDISDELGLNYDMVYQLHCTVSNSFELTEESKERDKNCDLAFLESHFDSLESRSDPSKVVIGGIYRHFKEGKLVKVIAVSRHSERPSEVLVIYECSNGVWSRPIDMFLSNVDTDKYPNANQEKRFELVKQSSTEV